MRAVFIMIPFLLFLACGKDRCRTDFEIEEKTISINVERLDQELFRMKSVRDVQLLLEQNPDFSALFLHADQYPDDSVLATKIFGLLSDPHIDTLYREAQQEYPDLQPITEDLETAFGKMQTLFPDTRTPVIQTAVTGLYNDLFISDSLIIIGLDFFIGREATYKPLDIPHYMLRRYSKEHLPSIIVKFMAGSHVNTGNKNTLLSEMIDYGKTYFLASRLLPCTPDSILLGYTPKDIEVSLDNEAIIWANLVQNEVLYETSHLTKRKFLGERPNVYEISQDCPGRIGAWMGWRIVEAYMQNNDVSIQELVSDPDNEKIFRLSKYKPQTR